MGLLRDKGGTDIGIVIQATEKLFSHRVYVEGRQLLTGLNAWC